MGARRLAHSGGILSLLGQFLFGFCEFRQSQEAFLKKQWPDVSRTHAVFESELVKIDYILEGRALPRGGDNFGDAARDFIGSIESVSRFVPSTLDELSAFVESIAELKKYCDVKDPPQEGSEEWLIFYGSFRADFDRYVSVREQYLDEMSGELGDYVRHVLNS